MAGMEGKRASLFFSTVRGIESIMRAIRWNIVLIMFDIRQKI